jgi:hypothetical protein
MPTKAEENDMLEPQPIDDGTNWVAISSGDYHLAAIKVDGTLWILGHNAMAVALGHQLGLCRLPSSLMRTVRLRLVALFHLKQRGLLLERLVKRVHHN